jgi:oxygen-independent coproporphyrinogen-3 oxidase
MQLLCLPAPITPSSQSHLIQPFFSLVVYFHVPFCRTRCTYCAYNTYVRESDRIVPYMQALRRELVLVVGTSQPVVSTIYFGGGTPSLIPVAELEATLRTCAGVFSLAPDVEISLEANPGTVDQDYLRQLRQIGINRLSFGMQSAHESELALFARLHRLDEVRTTVDTARAAGFDNINLDLIYGIPRQTLDMWRHSLETAISLNPNHLSLYSLSIENATTLQSWIAQGDLPAPDPDLAADMYEWASDRLAASGFEQYEISNWAKPGMACRHNLHVWRNLPYLGLGAGAHGYAVHTRYANVSHPAAYIERIENQERPCPFPLSAAAEEIDTIDNQQEMAETMFLGLRLTQEGITPETFRARFGRELWTVYGKELDSLIAAGLLERTPAGRVRLTPRGRLLGNHVFAAFV